MPTKTLFQRYQGLTGPARAILLMKAVLGPPTTKTLFLECMAHSRLTPPPGGWTTRAVNPILERLRGEGLLDGHYACAAPLLHPATVEAMARPDAAAIRSAVETVLPGLRDSGYGTLHPHSSYPDVQKDDVYRLLRLAVYANDDTRFRAVEALFARTLPSALRGLDVFGRAFGAIPLDGDWVADSAPTFRGRILASRIDHLLATGTADPALPQLMERCALLAFDSGDDDSALLWRLAGEYHLLHGRLSALETWLMQVPVRAETAAAMLRAGHALLAGDLRPALAHYGEARQLYRRETRRRKEVTLPGMHGLLQMLAMVLAEDPTVTGDLDEVLKAGGSDHTTVAAYSGIMALVAMSRGQQREAFSLVAASGMLLDWASPLAAAILAVAAVRIDPELARSQRTRAEPLFGQIRGTLPLVADMLAEVLVQVADDPAPYRAWLDRPGREVRLRVTAAGGGQDPWQRALGVVETVLFPAGQAGTPSKAKAKAREKRLAWFIHPQRPQVEVLEQVARGSGWSPGRVVSLKRLHSLDPGISDHLDDHDRAAARTIRKQVTPGWHREEFYDFIWEKTLTALIGCSRVFDVRDRRTPVELVGGSAELVVKETDGGLHMSVSHVADLPTVVVDEETPNRWRVVTVNQTAVNLAVALGANGVIVPKEARAQVEALVHRAGPTLPVRAEIDADDATADAGDTRPLVRLLPMDDTFKVTVAVRPGGHQGPVLAPDKGGRLLSATVDGRAVRVRRDLETEAARAEALVRACPTLSGTDDGSGEWIVSGMAPCLELLTELAALGDDVAVEWPQGRRLALGGEASAASVRAVVSSGEDWFAVEGSVVVDDDLVLDLKDLLGRLDRAEGRFVPLDDGRFLALTRQFRGQLDRLKAVGDTRGGGLRLAPIRAAVVSDFLDEAGSVEGDTGWSTFVHRFRTATDWQPRVPPTLQADLRDYQHEGFVWLARLDHWGAGACLADDMGLGKTVQTIAMLLSVAADGPCLVVAPTSVCANWETELTRFAPTLAVHRLAEASDRGERLAGLGPHQVLIASYGLLAREDTRLASVDWRMAILDEAQAIKNPDTRRAQAALGLQARFRVALTGTPVENRLDELWSLFAYVNPGLLGGRDTFQSRFAVPIERERSPAARQALKALVRPFLLRRTKAAVLSELPPRTEQTLLIELSPEERALYEALRQRAIEKLGDLADTDPGQRRIHILAEITRLRQACCHPALAAPESGAELPASKLETFLDLVDELRANGHRALVFSQFVTHLAKVRAGLDGRGVTYQYLDGSTPAKARERAVTDFQAGQGDLFLISLKAGGFGLNLTAADYVVHMDPWWNPAVEDQASDRAHRIGQTRPVTIYRLVVKDSIEERIVRLHSHKRDLADALLDGADTAARLNEDDLLALIQA